MIPKLPWYQWDNEIQVGKKKIYGTISFMNIDAKVFNNILANWFQQCIKRNTHNDQVEFTSDM